MTRDGFSRSNRHQTRTKKQVGTIDAISTFANGSRFLGTLIIMLQLFDYSKGEHSLRLQSSQKCERIIEALPMVPQIRRCPGSASIILEPLDTNKSCQKNRREDKVRSIHGNSIMFLIIGMRWLRISWPTNHPVNDFSE